MAKIAVTVDGHPHIVEIDLRRQAGPERVVVVDGREARVGVSESKDDDPLEWVVVDGRPYEVVVGDGLRWIRAESGLHQLEVRDLEATVARPKSGDGRVKAPIPGLIARVLVEPKARVAAGQPLVVLEAMKMENPIAAPAGGVVASVAVRQGQKVAQGELLAEIAPE